MPTPTPTPTPMLIFWSLLSGPLSFAYEPDEPEGPDRPDGLDELNGVFVSLGDPAVPVSVGRGGFPRGIVLKSPDESVVQSARNGAVPVQVNALRQQAKIDVFPGPRADVTVALFPDPSFISQQIRYSGSGAQVCPAGPSGGQKYGGSLGCAMSGCWKSSVPRTWLEEGKAMAATIANSVVFNANLMLSKDKLLLPGLRFRFAAVGA